ncbi:hypothetical protein IKF84_00615 [Candidatus Saccharibacteria bacterium]|nr:hypothetical protein [Candidatus Saccharibacteria bacterium]
MYRAESLSGAVEVDTEKSIDPSRARYQAFGNKALRIAELYKRREELLKKKADLEAKLRAVGINPEELTDQTHNDPYAGHNQVKNATTIKEARPSTSSKKPKKAPEKLKTPPMEEVPPRVVGKKAVKNPGFRKLIAGIIIAGLTTIITTTSLGGSTLKKNQKNIPKPNQTTIEETVADLDIDSDSDSDSDSGSDSEDDITTPIPVTIVETTPTSDVTESIDTEVSTAAPVNIDSPVASEAPAEPQPVTIQLTDIQPTDIQSVDIVSPQVSQVSIEPSIEQDSEDEAEEHHHHHHHKKNKKIDFVDEDEEDEEDEEEEEDWDNDWGDDLNNENQEGGSGDNSNDINDGLDYEIIEEPEALEPLAPPEAPAAEPVVEEPEILEPLAPPPEPSAVEPVAEPVIEEPVTTEPLAPPSEPESIPEPSIEPVIEESETSESFAPPESESVSESESSPESEPEEPELVSDPEPEPIPEPTITQEAASSSIADGLDMAIRTAFAEGAYDSEDAARSIADVIINRAVNKGTSVGAEVAVDGQFTAYADGVKGRGNWGWNNYGSGPSAGNIGTERVQQIFMEELDKATSGQPLAHSYTGFRASGDGRTNVYH